ncbi:transmembrane protein 265 [Bufo gargarizans]|uniref:transmembrane protein 265 n=1 Tax=Bufo gargarizans TaxID=30331 RepID=UPI001CF38D6D|nr:transmembrane protein 265 [Bufo gargarizans]
MTEAQQPQVTAISHDQKLLNGDAQQELQVLVSDPSQPSKPPDGQQKRRSPYRYFLSCSQRRLAIISIVCGVSCLGIKALILALQAEQESDQQMKATLSRRSRRFSVLSILLFVGALVSLPFLLVLISYLMTLIE